MKKIFCLLFACALCSAFALTACSSGSDSGSSTGKSAGTEAAQADAAKTNSEADIDYSKDILGIWEGRCTSEGSAFDDGQDHRWEYKADGSYVYYVKEGDKWVPSADTINEYSVDGNQLYTHWGEDGQDNTESWEISIDGDTMSWTAQREGDDGKSLTVTFEMKRVDA